MAKLVLKGGKNHEKPSPVREVKKPTPEPVEEEPESIAEDAPTSAPEPAPQHVMVTPEELRKAWEKLEGYHPLTEQALGEVLEAFLANRKA